MRENKGQRECSVFTQIMSTIKGPLSPPLAKYAENSSSFMLNLNPETAEFRLMNRFIYQHCKLLLLLLIGLTSLNVPDTKADFEPSAVRIGDIANAVPGDRFSLVFGTPEGVRYANLQVYAPYRSQIDGPSLVLVRGKIWGRQLNRRPIAGSIIDNKLRLEFVGASRRGRIFELEGRNSRFKLKRASPYWKLPCGTSSAKFAANYNRREAPRTSPAVRTLSLPISPTVQLDLATEADEALYAAWGAGTNAQIQDIINTSATVYLSQLGIVLNVADQHVFTSNDPFSSTNSADILTTFQNYTLSNRQLSSSADTFMLFSGLDFDDSIVGLAYVGVICADGGDYSFGIVQRLNSSIQSIVFAHELGHNFGANHDTSTQSIMSPYVAAGNTEFSTSSLSEMDSHLSLFNSCLAAGEPTLSLSLSNRLSTSSRRLRLMVTPTGKSAAGCVVRVDGATSTSALDSAAQEITGFDVGALSSAKTSNKLRKRRKSKQLVFRATATCEDGTFQSNVSRLRDDVRVGTRLRSSDYLSYLASRF